MKLDGISTFVAVAEAGSISEAARRLHLSKSVVSERLAELEKSLGASLLPLPPAGARGAGLSGSGTACFGLFDSEAAARQAEAELKSSNEPEWFCAAAMLCPAAIDFGES